METLDLMIQSLKDERQLVNEQVPVGKFLITNLGSERFSKGGLALKRGLNFEPIALQDWHSHLLIAKESSRMP